jgi:outer membrane lipoprotein SlyB
MFSSGKKFPYVRYRTDDAQRRAYPRVINSKSETGELMKTTQIFAATAIVATAFLSGCASAPRQETYSAYPASSAPSYSTYYGVVDSIQVTRASETSGVGAGAVVGGLVGGLLGNQVGHGSGKAAATAAGVVGGAVVGNQVEKSNQSPQDMYQISIRLDNGGYQTIVQDNVGDLRVGTRARIENGRAYRY